MGRHFVKNLHGVSAHRCHGYRVAVVERLDVLQHCAHWIVRGRHDLGLPSLAARRTLVAWIARTRREYFGESIPYDHENFHAADELCVAKLVAPQPAKPSRT